MRTTVRKQGSYGRLWPYGVAVLAVVIATSLALLLSSVLSSTLGLLFFGAVIVSARYGGFGTGVTATVLSVLSILFIIPSSWLTSGLRGLERLGVFSLLSFVISWLIVGYGRRTEAARASGRWFEDVFEASRDAIFLVDPEATFIEINRAACELTGYTREELLSMSIPDLHAEADLHAFRQYFDSIMAGKDVMSAALIQRNDGTKVPVEFSNRRMVFREKRVMHTTARDVTERKLAEEALKVSEERYRDLVESATDVIFTHNLDGQYTSVNKAGELITGYTRDEALALNLSQIVAPEYVEKALQMTTDKVLGREQTAYEIEIIAKNGRRIALEVISRLITQDGIPVGVQGIGRDITERKRAEKALYETEQRYRVVAETASDAIITIDHESTILYVNLAGQQIFGYTIPEMIGQKLTMLVPEHLRHAHNEGLQRYVTSGKKRFSWKTMEFPGLHKTGREIPLEISLSEFQKNGERFFTAIVRDVTERRRAEERLRERERQLVAAQQVAHIGSWEWDIEPNDVSWSDELYRIYGLQPQEFSATYQAFLDRIHPFDRDFVMDVISNALWDHLPFVFEHRIVRLDGEIRTLQGRGEVIEDDQGRAVKMFGIAQDITERNHEEEALRRAEEKYRSIFENAIEGIFQSTPDGQFIAVNPAMARMYGYDSSEEMIAERTDIEQQHYVDPQTRTRFRRLLEENDIVGGLEAEAYRKDGSKVWTSENVRAVRDTAGELLYYEGTIENISKRKQWEAAREQLLKARGQLLQRLVTAQEEERRRIARELHDQLGQQIAPLMLGLKWLRDSNYCQPPALEHLSHLQEYADQLGRELHNIAWELRPTALDDLGLYTALANYVEKWSERSGKIVQFHSNGFNGQRLSTQIETALYRIIQEALTNVLKHADANSVCLILERRQNHALAIVEDDGRGFDVEAIMNAPESERKFGLLGIQERLALVFGTLDIESTPGTGTTVFVRIPTPPASTKEAIS